MGSTKRYYEEETARLNSESMLEDLILALSFDSKNINEWEHNFLESCEGRTYESLTDKQQDKVNEIWQKYNEKRLIEYKINND